MNNWALELVLEDFEELRTKEPDLPADAAATLVLAAVLQQIMEDEDQGLNAIVRAVQGVGESIENKE